MPQRGKLKTSEGLLDCVTVRHIALETVGPFKPYDKTGLATHTDFASASKLR